MKYIFFLFSISLLHALSGQYPIEGHRLDSPSFLDSTISNYNIIFCPEMHWVSKNMDRRKKITNYLISQNKIDVIVLERSYAFGFWINHYMETGDSLFLKELFKIDIFSVKNNVQYVNHYGYYTWLREYTLQTQHPIKIIGIDLEALWEGEKVLSYFLKYLELNDNLKKSLKKSLIDANFLLKKKKITIGQVKKWSKALEKEMNKENIDDVFVKNFIHNLKQSYRWARGNPKNYRDREISQNFKRYTKPTEDIFGPYGAGHTGLKHNERTKHLREFGSILNEDPIYNGKILSIGLVSYNCHSIGNYSGDLHMYFTDEEIIRLSPKLRNLPHNTFVDLRATKEEIKEFVQLLLIVHN